MSTARKRIIQEPERVNPVEPVHIWRTPPGAAVEMMVVAHLSAYSDMHRQSVSSLPNETGGFLVGRVGCDQRGCWHVEIEQAVPVEPVSQDPVHFTFTWKDVDRVRSYREERGKALLGWYHTHPDLGIFLSETDLERTHRVLFSEPFQIALVYDPVRGRAGYFFWEGPQQIDAARADWREFEILVAPDPTTESGQSIPVVSAPALASVARSVPDVTSQPAVPSASPSEAAPVAAPASVPAPPAAAPPATASAPDRTLAATSGRSTSDEDTPAVPMPIIPGPIRPAAMRPVPESDIPTAPELATVSAALAAAHSPSPAPGPEVTRTQRLRQPDLHPLSDATPKRSLQPPPARPAANRPPVTSDRSADGGVESRTTVIVAGVVVIIAATTLILWLLVT